MEVIPNLKCLLCLTNAAESIKIFRVDEKKSNIAYVLKLHFDWLKLDEDNVESNNYVCSTCWKYIDDFHEFYVKISDIHNLSYFSIKNEILLTPIIKLESEKYTETEISSGSTSVSFMFSDDAVDKKNPNKKKEYYEDEESEPASTSDGGNETCENINDKKQIKRKRRAGEIKTDIKPEPNVEKIHQQDLLIKNFFKMVCEKCPEIFEKFRDVRSHYKVEHKAKGYLTCCDRKFYKRCLALEHIQRHTNPESFRCHICQKEFTRKRQLILHINSHELVQEKTFMCTKCPKSFSNKRQLQQHEFRHVPNEEKSFICNECGKAFANCSLLKFHIKQVHENAYGQICETCGKYFKNISSLNQHIEEAHNEVELVKIQCPQCGLGLKKSSYRSHMRSHDDEKRTHICDLCGKQSPNSRALKTHKKRVHFNKITYKCTLCEKAFKRATSLREHMATHTGEVLYTCPHCPKTFNSGSNMHSHRKKIHRNEWEESRKNKGINIKG